MRVSAFLGLIQFVLACAIFQVAADEVILPIEAACIPAKFSAADFRQERHLQALDRALVSQGQVALTSSGFIWHQLKPFENKLTYDGVSIVETTRMGTTEISRQIVDPASSNLIRTLYDMMTGSWGNLGEYFLIEDQPPASGVSCSMLLTPKDEAIRDMVPVIRVDADHYLQLIRIQQAGIDYTLIELSNQRSLP